MSYGSDLRDVPFPKVVMAKDRMLKNKNRATPVFLCTELCVFYLFVASVLKVVIKVVGCIVSIANLFPPSPLCPPQNQ